MYDIPFLKDFIASVKKSTLDDVIDRITYFWTATYCLVFAAITGTKMYFGSPIECMTPGEYNTIWSTYARQYCYVTATYDSIDFDWDDRERSAHVQHAYYQWVPTILVLQGISFYLPNFLWSYLQKANGLDFEYVVLQAKKARYMMDDARNGTVKDLVDYLKTHISYRGSKGGVSYRGFGCSNSLLHIASKMLTVFVILANLSFMNRLFGKNLDFFWGYTIAYNTIFNVKFDETGVFPRVTYCHFRQFEVSNPMERSASCVLMANMLNEKVFVFLWNWLVVVLIVSIANIFYSIAVLLVPYFRNTKGKDFLKPIINYGPGSMNLSSTGYEHVDNVYIESFVEDTLGADGVQLLILIKEHAGGYMASQIACALYDNLSSPRSGSLTDSANSETGFIITRNRR